MKSKTYYQPPMIMDNQKNKPKLADVARQNHTAKASKFSAMMVPPPPVPKAEVIAVPIEQQPVQEGVEAPAVEVVTHKEQVETPVVETVKKTPAVDPAPSTKTAKPVRTRRMSALSMEVIIEPKPPKGEAYPRQVRISEVHHKLLRRISVEYDTTINHVLYNLLDELDQVFQHEQQKGGK